MNISSIFHVFVDGREVTTLFVIGAYFVCISRVIDGEVALWALMVHISSVFHAFLAERWHCVRHW